MPGLYTITTRANGTTLTAAIYNADHQNHVDNEIPTMMDDYSSNVAQMQTVTDPGEVGSESLATSAAGELERLRFAIQDIKTFLGATSPQWYSTPLGAVWSTGDVKATLKTVADSGWVMMNDGTIGSATSGATTRANADTSALFQLLWNNTADAQCPVSTGRGGSAAADFSANKTIALPKMLGRALAAAGAGAGLTSRVLAFITGVETYALTQAETPVKSHSHGPGTLSTDAQGSHAHNVNMNAATGGSGFNVATISSLGGLDGSAPAAILGQGGLVNVGITDAQGSHAHNVTAGTTAAAADATASAHQNMQPTSFLNFMVKL